MPDELDLTRSQADGIFFAAAPITVHLRWNVRVAEDLMPLPGPTVQLSAMVTSFDLTRSETEARPEKGAMVKVEYRLGWGEDPIMPARYPAARKLLLEATDSRLTRLVFSAGEGDEDEDEEAEE